MPSHNQKSFFKTHGFTLIETMVSLAVFLTAIFIISAFYSIIQKSYIYGSDQVELMQNARVTLDRVSRELRQSVLIVTSLPATSTDPFNPPAQQVMFQDGHDISTITYIKYYLTDKNLMRDKIAYYFDSNPSTYVLWNSLDAGGNPPLQTVLESNIVGEHFDKLEFWGLSRDVNLSFTLSKNKANLRISSEIYTRN